MWLYEFLSPLDLFSCLITNSLILRIHFCFIPIALPDLIKGHLS